MTASPRALLALMRFSVRHPLWVVAITVALLAATAVGIPHVALRLDARSLIPVGQAELLSADAAAQRFGFRDVVVVGITHPDGVYQPAVLDWLAAQSAALAGLPGIVPGSVGSLATLPRLYVDQDVIDLAPLLSAQRPTPPEVAARLAHETVALGLDDGILVSREGRTAVIFAEVAPDADRYRLLAEVRAQLAGPAPDGATVALSGTAMAQAVLGEACARDLLRLLPIVLVLVFLALTLAFRHPTPALVSLVEIGVSLVIVAGVMGFAGGPVFVTTLVLPVIVLVIGVSDDVYALQRFLDAWACAPRRPRAEVLVETFAAVGRPVLFTAATTIASLLTLLATDLLPQRTFGLFGALAIAVSTLCTFTLVPALLVLLPLRPGAAPTATGPASWARRAAAALFPRHPGRVLAVAAPIMVAALWTASQLRIEDDWVRNLPPDSDVAQGDHHLNGRLAGTIRLELELDSGRSEGILDPHVFALLGRLEKTLSETPGVGAVTSLYSEVVRIGAALEGRTYAARRDDLAQGRRILTATDVETALLLLGSVRDSPLEQRIDAERRRARLSILVRDGNYSRIERILTASHRIAGPESEGAVPLDLGRALTPFGDGWVSFVAVRELVVGQVRSVGLAFFSDALLVFLLLRSARLTAVALAPVACAIVLVFAGLVIANHPLGIASAMFTAVALGIGIDYSIHLVAHFQSERRSGKSRTDAMAHAFDVTALAIAKSAAAIAAGFAALAFSKVLPNRELGVLIPASLAVCALATLVLVPAMILLRREKEDSQ